MAETHVTTLNLGLEISSLAVECPSSQSSMCEKKEELKFEDQVIKIADHDGGDYQLKNDQILVLIKVQAEMNNLNNDQGLKQNEQKQKQKQREIIYSCPRQSLQQQNKQQHKSMSQRDDQSSQENESSSSESEKSNPNAPFSSHHEQDESSSEKSSKSEKDKDQKLYPISQESINNSSSSDYPTYPLSSIKYESSIKKREDSNSEQSEISANQQRVAFKALAQLMGIYQRKTKKQIKSEQGKENLRQHRQKVKFEAPRKKQHQSAKKQQDQQLSSELSSSSSSSESLESATSQEQEYSSSSEEICESSSVNKSYRYRNKKSISESQFKDQKRVNKKTYQRESSSQNISKKERISKKRASKADQQPNLKEVLKCFDKVPRLINSIEELTSVLKTVFITKKDRKEQDKT